MKKKSIIEYNEYIFNGVPLKYKINREKEEHYEEKKEEKKEEY